MGNRGKDSDLGINRKKEFLIPKKDKKQYSVLRNMEA